jgi:nicotinamide phosphoribosyltransferase
MIPMVPVLLKDFYKVGHVFQYPKDTTMVYSNSTPRGSRLEGVDSVVVFGPQYFVLEYLHAQFDKYFFDLPKDRILEHYAYVVKTALGADLPSYQHIADLHDLGFLPLHIKALPEGTLCPMRVPYLTIRNTKPEFYWLTNMLETLLSSAVWGMINSATIAFQYRKVFEHYAKETGAPKDFVKWQGHDFSFRGMYGVEAAIMSGMAHLTSFTGTDTIPAIEALEEYYKADMKKELIGGSVPATEHSVMCVGKQENEFDTFKRLITEVYPKGIVSVVSDTWDFFKVLTDFLPRLREVVLQREGKLVIRPDSGDPVKIICGDNSAAEGSPERLGAVRLLHQVFGGRRNAGGYIELDPHIGLIYGDSITQDRQKQILGGLQAMGFASSNVVLGIGSFTYQYNTRDTFGQAIKATYCETLSGGPQPIFKKPVTDSGIKNSAKGLLKVEARGWTPSRLAYTDLHLVEDVSWEEESGGILQTIFRDGAIKNVQSLAEIRSRIDSYLY